MVLLLMLNPCPRMNSLSAWTVIPRRRMPWMVGKRGSFHPSTRLLSTNHCNLRFDNTVYTKFRRLQNNIDKNKHEKKSEQNSQAGATGEQREERGEKTSFSEIR
jgi:hypothetical protein